jgi:hypothetical protein
VPYGVFGADAALRGRGVIIVGQPIAQPASVIHRFGRGRPRQIKRDADKKQNGNENGDVSLPHKMDMP